MVASTDAPARPGGAAPDDLARSTLRTSDGIVHSRPPTSSGYLKRFTPRGARGISLSEVEDILPRGFVVNPHTRQLVRTEGYKTFLDPLLSAGYVPKFVPWPRAPKKLDADAVTDLVREKIRSKSGNKAGTGYTRVFRRLDLDHGGYISYDEFREGLHEYNIHLADDDFRRLCARFDTNNDQRISLDEFCTRVLGQETEAAIFQDGNDFNVSQLPVYPPAVLPSAERFRNLPEAERVEALERYTRLAQNAANKQAAPRLATANGGFDAARFEGALRRKLTSITNGPTPVREAFKKWSRAARDRLTYDELRLALASWNLLLTDAEFAALCARYDPARTGAVDLDTLARMAFPDDYPREIVPEAGMLGGLFSGSHRARPARPAPRPYPFSVERVEGDLREKLYGYATDGPLMIRRAFKHFDKDSNSRISYAEFAAGLANFHIELQPEELDVLYRRYDANGDGSIDLGEFVTRVLPYDYPQDDPAVYALSRRRWPQAEGPLRLHPDGRLATPRAYPAPAPTHRILPAFDAPSSAASPSASASASGRSGSEPPSPGPVSLGDAARALLGPGAPAPAPPASARGSSSSGRAPYLAKTTARIFPAGASPRAALGRIYSP